VRAADDERAFAANKKFLEQLGQGAITQFMIENVFGFGIASRDGVADDDQVWFVGKILFGVTGDDFDLAFGEKGGHRRIDVLVGASDLNAFFLHGRGGGSHCGAADTDEMNGLNARKHRGYHRTGD